MTVPGDIWIRRQEGTRPYKMKGEDLKRCTDVHDFLEKIRYEFPKDYDFVYSDCLLLCKDANGDETIPPSTLLTELTSCDQNPLFVFMRKPGDIRSTETDRKQVAQNGKKAVELPQKRTSNEKEVKSDTDKKMRMAEDDEVDYEPMEDTKASLNDARSKIRQQDAGSQRKVSPKPASALAPAPSNAKENRNNENSHSERPVAKTAFRAIVSNIPDHCDWKDLRGLFRGLCETTYCRIISERNHEAGKYHRIVSLIC